MTTRTGWPYQVLTLMDSTATGSVVGMTGEYSSSDLSELTTITAHEDDEGALVMPGHFSLVSPVKETSATLSHPSSTEPNTGTPSPL